MLLPLPRFALPALAAACLILPAAAAEPPVVRAGQSVYRLWIGLPLPAQAAAQMTDRQMLTKIGSRGYTLLPDGKGGVLTLFAQGGRLYLLLGHGSGYLVSKRGHIVSNDHVVRAAVPDALAQFGRPEIFVLQSLQPELKLLPGRTVFGNEAKDLAVIQADGLDGTPLKLADPEHIQVTMPVFSIGFPGASDDVAAERGFGDPEGFVTPVIAEGTVKRRFIGTAGTRFLEHHAPITHGNSGGPLINRCGQVVGTNEGGHSQQQNTVMAVSNEELAPLLEHYGIPYTAARGECADAAAEQAAGLQRRLYALMVLVLAATGGGWLYLLRLRRRLNHGGTVPPDKPQPPQHPAPPKTPPAAANGLSRTAGSAVLEPLHPAGRTIAMDTGDSLIFGRSADADIVLGQPQVSAHHLRLSCGAGSLNAEDLSSTNGSYLNGRRFTRTTAADGDILQLSGGQDGPAWRIRFTATPDSTTFSGSPNAALHPLQNGLPAIPLAVGRTLRIGRAADNDVILPLPQISAHHCRIRLLPDGGLLAEDTDSTNGTFADGIRIRRQTVLRPGQTLTLAGGTSGFVFRSNP